MTDELDRMYSEFGDDEDRRKGRIPLISEMAGTGEMLQAVPKAMTESAGATAKGLVQGTLGLPADIIGLVTGLMNMATVDPEGKGNLQQFAEGYNAVPFTSEKIGEFLESLGWKYEGETKDFELLGEVVSPGTALELGIRKLITKVNP